MSVSEMYVDLLPRKSLTVRSPKISEMLHDVHFS